MFGIYHDRYGESQGCSGGLRAQSEAISLLILFSMFELKE